MQWIKTAIEALKVVGQAIGLLRPKAKAPLPPKVKSKRLGTIEQERRRRRRREF